MADMVSTQLSRSLFLLCSLFELDTRISLKEREWSKLKDKVPDVEAVGNKLNDGKLWRNRSDNDG